jgi:hypothetical protein
VIRTYVNRRGLRPSREYTNTNPRSCHSPHYITSDDDDKQASKVDTHDNAETGPSVFVILSGIMGRVPGEVESNTMGKKKTEFCRRIIEKYKAHNRE